MRHPWGHCWGTALGKEWSRLVTLYFLKYLIFESGIFKMKKWLLPPKKCVAVKTRLPWPTIEKVCTLGIMLTPPPKGQHKVLFEWFLCSPLRHIMFNLWLSSEPQSLLWILWKAGRVQLIISGVNVIQSHSEGGTQIWLFPLSLPVTHLHQLLFSLYFLFLLHAWQQEEFIFIISKAYIYTPPFPFQSKFKRLLTKLI